MSPFTIPDAPPTAPDGSPIVGNTFITTVASSMDWSTLEYIREHVIRNSGMFQLVGQDDDSLPDYETDAGVDKYIRDALWMLLDLNPELVGTTKQSFSLLTGESAVAMPLVRLTSRVEIDGVELERLSWEYFRDEEVEDADGDPGYWCFETAQASTSPGILIGPVPTEDVTVDVWGRFYPAALSNGGQIIREQPQLLIDAATYKVQVAYGRKTEAAFSLVQVEAKLKTLHIDQTAQVMHLLEEDGLLTMEG
jgi:hypothetical protein